MGFNSGFKELNSAYRILIVFILRTWFYEQPRIISNPNTSLLSQRLTYVFAVNKLNVYSSSVASFHAIFAFSKTASEYNNMNDDYGLPCNGSMNR